MEIDSASSLQSLGQHFSSRAGGVQGRGSQEGMLCHLPRGVWASASLHLFPQNAREERKCGTLAGRMSRLERGFAIYTVTEVVTDWLKPGKGKKCSSSVLNDMRR